MTLTSLFPHNNGRQVELALTVCVHLLLLYGWHLSNRVSVDRSEAGNRIQWLLAPEPPKPAIAPRPMVPTATVSPRLRLPPTPALQREAMPSVPYDELVEEETVPAPGISMMERARSAVGGIDRALQEANKSKLIRAKPVSTQMRLERAMQKAHDMAPNRWYQPPKVTEIIDPGGYGRRRYRVVGANGTYCITIESNHAPDGIDSIQHGIKPKVTKCDDDEQAATKQDW
jgi:hypothetical protein